MRSGAYLDSIDTNSGFADFGGNQPCDGPSAEWDV